MHSGRSDYSVTRYILYDFDFDFSNSVDCLLLSYGSNVPRICFWTNFNLLLFRKIIFNLSFKIMKILIYPYLLLKRYKKFISIFIFTLIFLMGMGYIEVFTFFEDKFKFNNAP